MSAASRRCPGCGAESPRPEARYCEHCGAALAAAPAEPVEETAPPDPFGDLAARFRALQAHPDLARLRATVPTVPELAGKTLPSVLLLLFLAVLGLFASLLFFQLCPPLGFVPLALVGVGVLAAARNLFWNARTPLATTAALVAALRAQLQAGAERSPANTRHFVTLQDEHGTRAEHECFASAVPLLAVGALGVVYLKGERVCSFARVPV